MSDPFRDPGGQARQGALPVGVQDQGGVVADLPDLPQGPAERRQSARRPARRKFLRSRDAEQAYMVEGLRHLALGYPEVHFLLKTPARTLLAAPAPQTMLERVAAILGAEVAAHLLPFNLDGGAVKMAGLLSAPDFSLASNRFHCLVCRLGADQISDSSGPRWIRRGELKRV